MFKKAADIVSATSQSIETILGEGAVFEGTVTTSTGLRVDGKIIGDIASTGTVIVGASGEVQGKIHAHQMYIAGTVHGNVVVEDKTEFVSGGYLQGDLVTGDLLIEQGASFNGNCKTQNSSETNTIGALLKPTESTVSSAYGKEEE